VTDLRESLDELVAEHRRLGSPVGDYLRPGLPAADVERQLEALDLPALPDVADLYGWADGTDEEAWQRDARQAPFLRFIGDASFPALDSAAAWCRTVRELAQSTAADSVGALEPEALWHPSWFPIFRRDHGEFAMVCSRVEAPSVREVVWDMPELGRSFPTLTALIRAATRELREAFVWLADDRVLLRREVAALRPPRGG
jgi:cell wall assembly regulator SMI1